MAEISSTLIVGYFIKSFFENDAPFGVRFSFRSVEHKIGLAALETSAATARNNANCFSLG